MKSNKNSYVYYLQRTVRCINAVRLFRYVNQKTENICHFFIQSITSTWERKTKTKKKNSKFLFFLHDDVQLSTKIVPQCIDKHRNGRLVHSSNISFSLSLVSEEEEAKEKHRGKEEKSRRRPRLTFIRNANFFLFYFSSSHYFN